MLWHHASWRTPPECVRLSGRQVLSEMSKRSITVVIAAVVVALIGCQSLGLFGGARPTLMAPEGFPLILPIAMGLPHWLVVLAWGGAFVAWNPALLKGSAAVPPRTVALWLATAYLSAAHFLVSWRTGLVFAGPLFTFGSFLLNVIMFAACSKLLQRARAAPSFERALVVQLSLFAWVLTYAFPYFGEAP